MFEHALGRERGLIRIGTLALLISVAIVPAGKARAQDPIRIAGQPLAITPEFEPEHRSIAFKGPAPAGMFTVGGVTRVNCVAYSPDGKTLAVGDGPMRPICTFLGRPPINENGGLVRLIDPATGRVRMTLAPKKLPQHEYTVDQVVYAHDGKTLIAQGLEFDRSKDDGPILRIFTLWDVGKGEPLAQINSQLLGTRWSADSAIAPNGALFAVVTEGDAIRVRESPSGRERPLIKFPAPRKPTDDRVAEIQFSPDGRWIAVGCRYGDVWLFETETGRSFAHFPGRQRGGKAFSIDALTFSPDGKMLAANGSFESEVADKSITTCETTVYDLLERREHTIIRGRDDESFWSMTFLADGKALATGSADGSIRLWDTTTGKERVVYKGRKSGVKHLQLAPDGKTFAAVYWSSMALWNSSTGSTEVDLVEHAIDVTDLAFSPDGTTLASAGGDLKLWDLRAALSPRADEGHFYDVTCLAFSPDGRSLASANLDRTVKLWDLPRQRPTITLRGHHEAVCGLAFMPNGQGIASSDSAGVIKLWETATGKETASFQAHTDWAPGLAYSPDGNTLASESGLVSDQERHGKLQLWDGKTGKARTATEQFPTPISTLTFAPDGSAIAIGCKDDSVIVVDPASGKRRARLFTPRDLDRSEGVISLAYSPNGKLLAASYRDRMITLRAVTNGEPRLAGTIRFEGLVAGVAFSPDAKYFVVSDRRAILKVWDVANQKEVASTKGETDWFRSISISPDGKRIAAGSGNGSILIWDFEKILTTHRFPN